MGSVSLLLSDRIQDAILFEPNAVAAARARDNLASNHLEFKVYELALSDTNGEIRFSCDGPVDVGGHVVVNEAHQDGAIGAVQCMTFDDFLRRHGPLTFPVSLVKIDVEGHENSVLRGMREFLGEHRPPLVMFEYLERTNLADTISLFQRLGYQVFELGLRGPSAVTGRVEPLQDLFACPLEHGPLMGLVGPS